MKVEIIVSKISDVLFILSLFVLLFAVVDVYGYDTKNVMLLLSALYYFAFATGMFVFDKLTKLMCYLSKRFKVFRCD